jgi:hypothetical protein
MIKHELNKQNIIQKEHKWKYSNMNSKAPNVHATIKLHKQNTPIRPVVNWKNSPAYNLAKFVTNALKETLDLPFTYNIKNSTQLINNLNNITINENTRICSFDIKDMYTNIPQQDTILIIHNILQNYNENVADDILNMLQITLQQNYFQFDNQYYKQNIGLAMGASTSAIIAQTYLQNLEHNQIYNFLTKYKLIGYFRYIDDILIIYDINNIHIDTMINEFNTKHPMINFTIENEENNKLNFLDLTIHRKHNKLDYTVCRKSTVTHILIHNSSCHPPEHKLASINYLTNRLHSYPLSEQAKDTELNTIKTMLQNNQYKFTHIQQKPRINNDPKKHDSNTKWATFTHTGREIKNITKVLKDANINIAYKTKNTIEHILQPKLSTTTENI